MKDDLIEQVVSIIADENLEEGDIIYKLKRAIQQVELQNSIVKESEPFQYLIAQSLKYISERKSQDLILKTGFKEIDEEYGGFSRGEMIVIGGRPCMGKTQLMINLALNIAKNDPVLYFSYDLSQDQLGRRMLSSLTSVSALSMNSMYMSEEQLEKIMLIKERVPEFQLFVNESCASSMTAFRAVCERHIQQFKIKAIFVDYIQLMGAYKGRNYREQEISYVSRELKNIAKEFQVCVIVASQLSRAVEYRAHSRRPWLSDLRDSGAIEQDADKVIFIYRPEYYDLAVNEDGTSTECMAELIFAKNRNGLLGEFKISRDPEFTTFMNYLSHDFNFNFSESRLIEFTATPKMDSFGDDVF